MDFREEESKTRKEFLSFSNRRVPCALTAPVKVAGSALLPAQSHTYAVPSAQAVTIRCPSGANEACKSRLLCLRMGLRSTGCIESASQSRALPSRHAVRINNPSGLNLALMTASPCLRSGRIFRLLPTSHTLAL